VSELGALDAGPDADGVTGSSSGSSGSGSTSSSGSTSGSGASGSSSGAPTQDASACVQPYIGTAACDACTEQRCSQPTRGQWCSCAQDPLVGPNGVPGCVSYLECELACLRADASADCPSQCAAGYTQDERLDANGLVMCLTSQCSSACDLASAGSSSSGGPADAGSDAPGSGGPDAGACASLGQGCYSCCQTDNAAGSSQFFADAAACLCNGGPCTNACSAPDDYCASPGSATSQGCQTCVNTYTAPGAQCDAASGMVASACSSQPQCVAYLACANECP